MSNGIMASTAIESNLHRWCLLDDLGPEGELTSGPASSAPRHGGPRRRDAVVRRPTTGDSGRVAGTSEARERARKRAPARCSAAAAASVADDAPQGRRGR
jgi:hypothetical protein